MATVRVPPAGGEELQEPVALEEAKLQCRIIGDDFEDALVQAYIAAAREHAETVTRRTLIASTWDHMLDKFPAGAIRLPMPPLIDVESVHYIAPDGEAVELERAAYQVDKRGEYGLVMPAPGASWPATRQMPGAVWVRYRAGYESGIPQGIKVAMLLMIGHWYANREAVVVGTITSELPMAVDRLLWGYRLYEVS